MRSSSSSVSQSDMHMFEQHTIIKMWRYWLIFQFPRLRFKARGLHTRSWVSILSLGAGWVYSHSVLRDCTVSVLSFVTVTRYAPNSKLTSIRLSGVFGPNSPSRASGSITSYSRGCSDSASTSATDATACIIAGPTDCGSDLSYLNRCIRPSESSTGCSKLSEVESLVIVTTYSPPQV